ncbi:MAG: putative PEP-binding protein [Chlamydiia bacterium]
MMTTHSLVNFEGKSILKGVASGPLVIYREKSFQEKKECCQDLEENIHKYHQALAITKKEIQALLKRLNAMENFDSVSIFQAHLSILDDPLFTQQIESKMRTENIPAQQALESAIEGVVEALEATLDPFFRERILDLKDLQYRITYHLHGAEPKIPQTFQGAIVCVKEVSPSLAAQGALKGVKGFISLNGSSASHTSVVLKSRAIGHLLLEDLSVLEPYEGKMVLMDSQKGVLYIDPSPDFLESTGKAPNTLSSAEGTSGEVCTIDGQLVRIYSTFDGVEYSSELKNGIGLYRTEFYLLHDREIAFCEERQTLLYQSILEEVKPQKVVFRLFDLGGDKNFLHDLDPKRAKLRSVQYLIERSEILELQLSSLMKAQKNSPLFVLIPYVVKKEELELIQKEIFRLQNNLESTLKVHLGAMIETPLSEDALEGILEVADFLAIGTNDLTQALIEIHRDSPDFCSFQPELFRTIRQIIQKASDWGKPVSVCGEIVSNPVFTELLIGLGATDFSCSFHEIPQIKRKILTSERKKSFLLAEKVCAATSSFEVKTLLH